MLHAARLTKYFSQKIKKKYTQIEILKLYSNCRSSFTKQDYIILVKLFSELINEMNNLPRFSN
jgi:hypothetical protein